MLLSDHKSRKHQTLLLPETCNKLRRQQSWWEYIGTCTYNSIKCITILWSHNIQDIVQKSSNERVGGTIKPNVNSNGFDHPPPNSKGSNVQAGNASPIDLPSTTAWLDKQVNDCTRSKCSTNKFTQDVQTNAQR